MIKTTGTGSVLHFQPPAWRGVFRRRRAWMAAVCLAVLGSMALQPRLGAAEKPNILFIAVDDLNHWVGHLGRNAQTKTPHLDRLAKMGVTFTRAYCAAPVCNPSRAALLSGRRPGATGVYDNNNPFAAGVKLEESLVWHLKSNGWRTMGMGKLWHGGLGFPQQWDETGGRERGGDHGMAKVQDRSIGGIKFGVIEGGDESVPDTQIADYGVKVLTSPPPQPFFLTLGFHKPHMPWNVPQKYYDLHPLADIKLPPVKEHDLTDVPAEGVRLARAMGDHARVVESGRWKEAVQAYLAAISYLDGQVGRVLNAWEKSPAKNNTIICLWGDHGWHLGEKEHWRKFALWEESTRAPFIWVVPGVTQPGGVCGRTVDFMSIYPTLCDLAGIAKPAHVEGANIRPLLANPAAAWEQPAVTTYGRNNHAVRSEQWRYIRYHDGGEELYDHTQDPHEWTNVAGDPARAEVKAALAKHFPQMNVAPVQGVGGGGRRGARKAAGEAAPKKEAEPQ
jgi:arylsulfatase A-like enzyme